MKYKELAAKIITLKNADLAFRDQLIKKGELGGGYHQEMEHLHNSNSAILNEIIDSIGYPTIDKVGEEASDASWLVIQHAIGKPNFMKKCLHLLEKAVKQKKANPIHLAYLSDRIASFEGRPLLYGTQFDWNEEGVLSPKPVDDIKKVNQRRKALDLNTLEEQTILIRKRAKKENQSPPENFEQRKQEFKKWKKAVGWTK